MRYRSSIDLKDLEYLWKDPRKTKVLLTFYKTEIPDILRAKSHHLASFNIYTHRAFTDTTLHVLTYKRNFPSNSIQDRSSLVTLGGTRVSADKESRGSSLLQSSTNAKQQFKEPENTLLGQDQLNPLDPQNKFQTLTPPLTGTDSTLVTATVPNPSLQAGGGLNVDHILTPQEIVSFKNSWTIKEQQILEETADITPPLSIASNATQANTHPQLDKLLNEFRNSLNTKQTLHKDLPWIIFDHQSSTSLPNKLPADEDPTISKPFTSSNCLRNPPSIHMPKSNITNSRNGSIFYDQHSVLDQLVEQD